MVATEETTIDKIKNLYSQVKAKTKFIEKVAVEINRSPKSLRNHWFSEFWSIPEEHQKTVLELLQKEIKEQ